MIKKSIYAGLILMAFALISASQIYAEDKININTATASELTALPGIGDKIAEDIIAYRTEHGGFKSVEELIEVDGIGEKKFEAIKDLVTVEGAPAEEGGE